MVCRVAPKSRRHSHIHNRCASIIAATRVRHTSWPKRRDRCIHMKLDQERGGWPRRAVRAVVFLGAAALLYVAGRLASNYLPSFSTAPCEHPDGLDLAAHGLQSALLAASIILQVRAFRKLTYASAILALLMPLAAWIVQQAAESRDTSRQRKCAARPLNDAMRACGADPTHYRRENGSYGSDILTLVAPGTTDRAWSCLARWSDHNGTVSITVDESVYQPYRATHSERH